jgi:hypothetical protein
VAVFRVQLADGEKKLKVDLKAANEALVRRVANIWFDGARWHVVDVRRLAD